MWEKKLEDSSFDKILTPLQPLTRKTKFNQVNTQKKEMKIMSSN